MGHTDQNWCSGKCHDDRQGVLGGHLKWKLKGSSEGSCVGWDGVLLGQAREEAFS